MSQENIVKIQHKRKHKDNEKQDKNEKINNVGC